MERSLFLLLLLLQFLVFDLGAGSPVGRADSSISLAEGDFQAMDENNIISNVASSSVDVDQDGAMGSHSGYPGDMINNSGNHGHDVNVENDARNNFGYFDETGLFIPYTAQQVASMHEKAGHHQLNPQDLMTIPPPATMPWTQWIAHHVPAFCAPYLPFPALHPDPALHLQYELRAAADQEARRRLEHELALAREHCARQAAAVQAKDQRIRREQGKRCNAERLAEAYQTLYYREKDELTRLQNEDKTSYYEQNEDDHASDDVEVTPARTPQLFAEQAAYDDEDLSIATDFAMEETEANDQAPSEEDSLEGYTDIDFQEPLDVESESDYEDGSSDDFVDASSVMDEDSLLSEEKETVQDSTLTTNAAPVAKKGPLVHRRAKTKHSKGPRKSKQSKAAAQKPKHAEDDSEDLRPKPTTKTKSTWFPSPDWVFSYWKQWTKPTKPAIRRIKNYAQRRDAAVNNARPHVRASQRKSARSNKEGDQAALTLYHVHLRTVHLGQIRELFLDINLIINPFIQALLQFRRKLSKREMPSLVELYEALVPVQELLQRYDVHRTELLAHYHETKVPASHIPFLPDLSENLLSEQDTSIFRRTFQLGAEAAENVRRIVVLHWMYARAIAWQHNNKLRWWTVFVDRSLEYDPIGNPRWLFVVYNHIVPEGLDAGSVKVLEELELVRKGARTRKLFHQESSLDSNVALARSSSAVSSTNMNRKTSKSTTSSTHRRRR